MPDARALLNNAPARSLGMTVQPFEGQYQENMVPEAAQEPPQATPAALSPQSMAVAPAEPAAPPQLIGAPGSRERKVAVMRSRLAKYGMKDDEELWSNHLADLFDAKIQADQIKQHKAHTIGAISSFLPSVTQMYGLQRGLAAQNDMMKQYEAEAKAKGIDLSGDEHYLTMKRQAATGQAKLMQQLEAVDQMYGDLKDKHGIDFGEEGAITPLAIRMLLSDVKSGKVRPRNVPGGRNASPVSAGAGPLASNGGEDPGGTPVDTDGDGIPDVLMPDDYLASLNP